MQERESTLTGKWLLVTAAGEPERQYFCHKIVYEMGKVWGVFSEWRVGGKLGDPFMLDANVIDKIKNHPSPPDVKMADVLPFG